MTLAFEEKGRFAGFQVPGPIGRYGPGCYSSPQKHCVYSQLTCRLSYYVAQNQQLEVIVMVKKSTRLVNADFFKESTDAIFTPVSHEQLADELGCSVSLIRQARRDQSSPSFRHPPAGWEVTVRRMLEARADHFAKLAQMLKADRQDD